MYSLKLVLEISIVNHSKPKMITCASLLSFLESICNQKPNKLSYLLCCIILKLNKETDDVFIDSFIYKNH